MLRSSRRARREKLAKSETKRSKDFHDLRDIQEHYTALEKSKLGILVHISSQHSILDVLYGGDTGRPMPSWTHQTTPEVGVSDQQHTGRCWIFATLAVLGHVFRSQYGISNSRATLSEGYLGFWDLYEKSRLFLHVALDTRDVPLDDPSLSDLLKNGISDGGDYIFCLNLLDRYGIVPTEYYPNSSYGSMSTEALVTLVNQVLRDNVITLRTTGDKDLINPMLTNIFSILCMGLGTPPAPWKKMDWQIDQSETMAQFAADITIPSTLPPEEVPWRPSLPRQSATAPAVVTDDGTFTVKVPPKPSTTTESGSMSDLINALSTTEVAATLPSTEEVPPSPTVSNVTAEGLPDENYGIENPEDVIPSSTSVIVEETATQIGSSEPLLTGIRPPRRIEDVPTRDSSRICVDIGSAGDCKRPGSLARVMQRLTPAGCNPEQPREGSGSFFREIMPDSGCLLGRQPTQACRLAHTITSSCAPSERPRVEDSLLFDYTPRDFYYRFLSSVRFVPLVCDARFPCGTRIISNDANMYGGLPSLYLNVSINDIEAYTVASLKRNIPVWFACDVKKQLTPEGGRMCSHTDRLAELLPEPHKRASKLQEIRHFNAIANHALLISAVSIKAGKPSAWRIVNSWGDVGRNSGVFVACGDWFREHVYSVNAIYDSLSEEHRQDIDLRLARPTARLGPFDPSVI